MLIWTCINLQPKMNIWLYTNIVEYSLQGNKQEFRKHINIMCVCVYNWINILCHADNDIYLSISPFSTTSVPVTLHFSAVLVLPAGRTTNATAPGIVPHRRTEEELLDLQRWAVLADAEINGQKQMGFTGVEISLLILGCPWKSVTS